MIQKEKGGSMTNTSESFSSFAMRWSGDIQTRYSMLWDSLLDDDNGISEESYDRLMELGRMIDPNFVKNEAKHVGGCEGRFYIKSKV